MITFIEGNLEEKQPARAILNCGGIGYEILIPLSSYDRLPEKGESCRLLTYEHIREDSHDLFGFSSEDERIMFMRLTGISGIGPKLALSALSTLSTRELKLAISNGDTKRLSSVSGIGKRTAERVIVELRGKITAGEALEASSEIESKDVRLRDAVMALVSLGHKQADAQKMLKKSLDDITPDMSVEDIVRISLSH